MERENGPSNYPKETLSHPFNAVYDNFIGEVAICEVENREHWSPLVNKVKLQEDSEYRNNGLGRYSSKRNVLGNYFKGDKELAFIARRRAYFVMMPISIVS